jgi:septal ring factor EnvC (AmiA/AmiB activator)
MATTKKRFKEKFVDSQVLYDNIAPRLTDLPQLADHHKTLGDVLAQARTMEGQQETLKGQLRDLNDRRQKASEQAADLRRRLTAGLQAALGPDSKALLELGIKPRPTSRRPRVILTPAQRAARAAQRAVAKATALAAEEQPATPPPAPAPTTR